MQDAGETARRYGYFMNKYEAMKLDNQTPHEQGRMIGYGKGALFNISSNGGRDLFLETSSMQRNGYFHQGNTELADTFNEYRLCTSTKQLRGAVESDLVISRALRGTVCWAALKSILRTLTMQIWPDVVEGRS
ncbi:hypothetical protein BPOR_0144g00020 [Botrytis porri]|uniref:Uncharacterized protein n=1 Tax=Botrytis porri TaxID=87229 RepID=A0A4Z1KW13_9HELO|nr:hypothetical protein BPOR_0144g00020 [Botrytis porri]